MNKRIVSFFFLLLFTGSLYAAIIKFSDVFQFTIFRSVPPGILFRTANLAEINFHRTSGIVVYHQIIITTCSDSGYCSGNDHILIVVDSSKNYIGKDWTELPDAQQKWNE